MSKQPSSEQLLVRAGGAPRTGQIQLGVCTGPAVPRAPVRRRPGNKSCIGSDALRSEGLGAAVTSNAVIGALAGEGSKAAHKLPAAYCWSHGLRDAASLAPGTSSQTCGAVVSGAARGRRRAAVAESTRRGDGAVRGTRLAAGRAHRVGRDDGHASAATAATTKITAATTNRRHLAP